MVIYISGPMSGLPDYNRATFMSTAKQLESEGHTVLNPAILPDGMEYEAYIRIGLAMVRECDTIKMLPGWRDSLGASKEMELAIALGRCVTFA